MKPSTSHRTVVSDRAPKIVMRGEGPSLNVIGDTHTVKLTGTDTQGRFTLIKNLNPPGTTLPMHTHYNEDEVFYVVEGQVEFTANAASVLCEAGATVEGHFWNETTDRCTA